MLTWRGTLRRRLTGRLSCSKFLRLADFRFSRHADSRVARRVFGFLTRPIPGDLRATTRVAVLDRAAQLA